MTDERKQPENGCWIQRKVLHWLLAHSWPGLTEERLERMLAKAEGGSALDADEQARIRGLGRLAKSTPPAHVARWLDA